jgi:hypothetical protein
VEMWKTVAPSMLQLKKPLQLQLCKIH